MENLRPACFKCNRGMGTMHLVDWILVEDLTYGLKKLDLRNPETKMRQALIYLHRFAESCDLEPPDLRAGLSLDERLARFGQIVPKP